jgi:predicted transposase/invertase (TIGR01784 family)
MGGSDKNKGDRIFRTHDRAFKDFFEERDVASSFLQEYLPENIIKELDFESLKISKDSFVDKGLKEYLSDILYEVKLKNRLSFIYLLFEHKSQMERFVAFQLLKYMVRIWENFLKQNKKAKYLPVIIPLVIYHGRPRWRVDSSFKSLFESPGKFEPYLPDFRFELYDISHLPDDELRGSVLLRILLITLKYIFNPKLRHKLPEIFELFGKLEDKNKATEYLEVLLRYLTYRADDITEKELQESVDQTLEDGGKIMPTLAQKWMEQGEEKGMERMKWDVVKNALAIDLPIEKITRLTGLPPEKIKLMKSRMKLKDSSDM